MKKITAVIIAFSLLAAACGGDEEAIDPSSIESCQGAAEATIALAQDLIDTLASLDQESQGAVFAGGDLPTEITNQQTTASELGAKVAELGCTDFGALLVDKRETLQVADGDGIGSIIRDAVTSGKDNALASLFLFGADPDPASLATCEEVADGTVVLLQDLIDLLWNLDDESLAAVFSGGDTPDEFDALETTGATLATRAQELGCEGFRDLISERAGVLEVAPEDGLGQMIKNGAVSGEEDVLGRLFR